jgi:hypothetical protein
MQIKFVDHQTLIKLADCSPFQSSGQFDRLDDIKEAVRNAISRLPRTQQTIINMYFFENASLEQIIDETGLSPRMIRRLMSAAKTTLRYSLQDIVNKQWPSIGRASYRCPICLHKARAAIDKMIREKPDSQSWRMFNQNLSEKFGVKVNPPIMLKYHIKYHQKG